MNERKVIRGCYILDSATSKGYLENQDILVFRNHIEDIVTSGYFPENVEVLDGQGLLAIPGLINAHTHSPEYLLRATSEKMSLEVWLIHQFTELANFPPELIYWNTLANSTEMLLSGTTAVLDHFWMSQGLTLEGLNAVMEAYRDSGMRVAVAPMLEDSDRIISWVAIHYPDLLKFQADFERPKPKTLLYLMRQFLLKWHGQQNGRLKCLLGPGGLQWSSDYLLTGCYELAEEFGSGIHIHLNETAIQSRICQEIYQETAVKHLRRLKLLGPASSLAHVIWVNSYDIKLLAESQATVVHNPISNLKLGSGLASIMEMLQAGINICLGTDGAASNDNQNMFAVMKMTGLLHSPAIHPDKGWISSKEVFEMASANSARAIGAPDQLGEIRPGRLADITFLAFDPLLPLTGADLKTFLVFTETGEAVRHVMVDGEWVVLNRKCVRFSQDEVRENLLNQAESYFTRNPRKHEDILQMVSIWNKVLQCVNSTGGLIA